MHTALYAEFTIKPGAEERVAEMMLALTARVLAEPGNIVFLPYTEAANPRQYIVFEVYVDDAAFQEHLAADYGAAFNAELAELIEGDASELTFLRPVNGVVLVPEQAGTGRWLIDLP
jgi:quinol monooxygenase YgiN